MKLSEHVEALRSVLTELPIEKAEALDDVQAKLVHEQDAFDVLRKQRLDAEFGLEAFHREAEVAKAKIRQEVDVSRNDRAVELQNHGKVIEAGQAALTELKDKIAKARQEHDALTAAIDAIRKRLG